MHVGTSPGRDPSRDAADQLRLVPLVAGVPDARAQSAGGMISRFHRCHPPTSSKFSVLPQLL